MALRPLKSILLKLNSSFKRIFDVVPTSFFQSSFKQPSPSGASCLSRCLIYKVHTVRFTFHRVAAGFKFITSFRLCQELFSSFFNFFKALSLANADGTWRLRGGFVSRRKALAYISKCRHGCQYLFFVFFLFFQFFPFCLQLFTFVRVSRTLFRLTSTCAGTAVVILL